MQQTNLMQTTTLLQAFHSYTSSLWQMKQLARFKQIQKWFSNIYDHLNPVEVAQKAASTMLFPFFVVAQASITFYSV